MDLSNIGITKFLDHIGEQEWRQIKLSMTNLHCNRSIVVRGITYFSSKHAIRVAHECPNHPLGNSRAPDATYLNMGIPTHSLLFYHVLRSSPQSAATVIDLFKLYTIKYYSDLTVIIKQILLQFKLAHNEIISPHMVQQCNTMDTVEAYTMYIYAYTCSTKHSCRIT